MSRAARTAAGAVVAGVLAFVALVSMVMSFAGPGGDGPGLFEGWDLETLDTPATAEVLDVDDNWDWPTVDVRWTTEDGEVVVTYVDWEWGELPEVGDQVGVVYDSADPEYAFAADDPYVDGVLDGTLGGPAPTDEVVGTEDAVAAEDAALARASGYVALASLAGLVLTVLVTVVAVVRAPAPVRQPHVPSVYEAPLPSGAWGPPGQADQPRDPYGYPAATAPPQHAPGPWQAPRTPAPDGSWPTPG
ncbi:hypothetical protein [Aquipuribacter hungaricus]|uniref:hypothetical protein n=1 Tax=Aquipuribacter hungaricus TaxID=545624 RepID=UPI00360CAA85